MILFRVFQGIGAALIYNTVTSIVVMAVPKNKRGRTLGLTIASVYIGLGIAPFIGGILTHHIGWRGIFEFSVPILLSVLLITLLKVKKEWKPFSEESFDKIGSILYGIGILLIIYGFTILNQIIGILLVIIGLIVTIIFIITERKIEYPILNISVFRNKKFVSSNLAAFISYLATFIVTYILNYHFQYIRGLNPEISGLILVVTPVVMAIVSPFSGYLSDKINPQKLAAIGMSFVTLALFILIFLNKSTSLYLIILAMFLQGLGFGIFSTPNTNTVMSSVPPKETPTASVAVTFMRVVGQSMSLAMLTVIFTIIMSNVPIIPKYYGLLILSSQTALIISTGLCLIAIIASVIGIKSKKIDNIN